MISYEEAEKWLKRHTALVSFYSKVIVTAQGNKAIYQGSGNTLLEAVEKAMESANENL